VRPTPIQVQGIPTVWVSIVLGSVLLINKTICHKLSQFSHTNNVPKAISVPLWHLADWLVEVHQCISEMSVASCQIECWQAGADCLASVPLFCFRYLMPWRLQMTWGKQ
jgi:hypothetical protein